MTIDRTDIAAMLEARSLGSPRNAVGFVLWRVVHRFQRDIDQALKPLDLTHLQFTVLSLAAWMEKSEGPASQAALARHGSIHVMQVSNVLKALEEKGMVSRATSGGGPAKAVALTAKGLESLGRAFPLAIDVQRRLFGEAGRPGGALLEAMLAIDEQADRQVDPADEPSGNRSREP